MTWDVKSVLKTKICYYYYIHHLIYFILLQGIKCEIKSEADEFDTFIEQIDIKPEIQLCSDLLTSIKTPTEVRDY